jgi:hypothetical protein
VGVEVRGLGREGGFIISSGLNLYVESQARLAKPPSPPPHSHPHGAPSVAQQPWPDLMQPVATASR